MLYYINYNMEGVISRKIKRVKNLYNNDKDITNDLIVLFDSLVKKYYKSKSEDFKRKLFDCILMTWSEINQDHLVETEKENVENFFSKNNFLI